MAALRVLLVEDEGLIRLLTAEVLHEEGFEVMEAWNGVEAIRLLDGPDGFDVLFTDVRMPGPLDGIDVAEHARRLDPSIPILVVSGYAVDLRKRLSALEPAAVFLSKPYNMTEIVDALRRLLATR
jgi:CheY-like chemotaxis protein